MTAHCPVSGDLCPRLDCDPDHHECVMSGEPQQSRSVIVTRPPARFAIKQKDGGLYIRSDIDSGGMSVVLAQKVHADEWNNEDEAAAFMRRCAERYSGTALEVVVL